MTEQELRIARLSKIMNSGLRVATGNKKAHHEAYERVVSSLQQSLENEKLFNLLQEKKQKLREKAERKQELMRDSIYRHHFKVLTQQIEEKKRNRQIEEKELVLEKELTEETYRPRHFKIKDSLDAQVEEKKRLLDLDRQREAVLDKLRLDLARKSLESEMKNKSEGKQKLQNQLRESWERTQNTNKLQKAIDRLRRFGDNYDIDSEEELDADLDCLDNHETGKKGGNNAKLRDSKYRKPHESRGSALSKSLIVRKRSNSALSAVSKTSQLIAIEKLNKLKEEENKIKKEKLDLLSFLESRSQSKVSSRQMTGASLLSKTVDIQAHLNN